jgi:hypothetical protein
VPYTGAAYSSIFSTSSSGGTDIDVSFTFTASSGSVTLTGLGPTFFFNYTSADVNNRFVDATGISLIESATSIPLYNGSAFDISVVHDSVSAIPEPSTYAAFAGLAALGLAMVRKRRRTA